jgi:hypothetical protein
MDHKCSDQNMSLQSVKLFVITHLSPLVISSPLMLQTLHGRTMPEDKQGVSLWHNEKAAK